MLNSTEQKIIGIHDESGMFAAEFKDGEQVQYLDYSDKSLVSARQEVLENEYFGLIHISEINSQFGKPDVEFFGKDTPGFGTIENIEKTISDKLTREQLIAKGIDVSEIDKARADVSVAIQNFAGEQSFKNV